MTLQVTSSGAYGARLGSVFRTEAAPPTITTRLRGETFAVTRLRRTTPNLERTDPLAEEQAFHFGLQLVDRGNVELWTGNKLAFKGRMVAGTLSMMDIALRPSSRADGLQDAVLYYVPRRALDEVARERDGGPVTELRCPPGISVVDPVVHHLSMALLPALEHPECVSRIFFEHVALAFQEHVVQTYGQPRRKLKDGRGGLAPWQQRRAKELIRENLDGGIAISRLAEECRLSRSHFVRAFKESTGLPPHRWLTQRRIDAAKTRMRDSPSSLADIARECGFAHQSHFAKVFTEVVGESPSAWRRANGRGRR
ncbi:MAG: transcriptional regulator [Labilithrix sp.]|nr:transcriptional regulator [Labilithrix sp.]